MIESSYAGKTLDEWAVALTDPSPSPKQEAATALGAIGATGNTRAVEVLLEELNKPIAPFDAKRAHTFTTIDLLGEATEIDADAAVQAAIVTAISQCGDSATLAVPRLCELLGRDRARGNIGPMRIMIAIAMGDAAVTNAASDALASIGKPAFPRVCELLQSPVANTRSAAARILGLMGPIAREAVPELERLAFRDPYEATRTNAQRSLERLR
jgi:HEAT repeat protein